MGAYREMAIAPSRRRDWHWEEGAGAGAGLAAPLAAALEHPAVLARTHAGE